MAFIKAATVRRDARAFTNVAPTMPGIVWPINKLITNAQYGTPTSGLSHNGTHNAGTKMIGNIAHHALSPARRINTMIPVVKIPTPKPPTISRMPRPPNKKLEMRLPMPIGTIKNGKA